MTDSVVVNLSFFRNYSVVANLRTILTFTGGLGALVLGLAGARAFAQPAPASDLLQVADHCITWADAGFPEETPFEADANYEALFAAGPNSLFGRTGTGMTVELSRDETVGVCALTGEGAQIDDDVFAVFMERMNAQVVEGQASEVDVGLFALCGTPPGLLLLTLATGDQGVAMRMEWGTGLAWGTRGGCVD